MDCKKAQRLYDELAEGRVAEPMATELHRHLDECTDCRVLRHRAARLQQLLSLKRHEQPAPAYFNNFLADFHRRLDVEAMRPTWRQRLVEAISVEIAPIWRYGLVGTCAGMLALGLVWKTYRPAPAVQLPQATLTASATTAALSESTGASSVQRLAFVPAAWNPEDSRPQYVLERIAVTPASYETASVRF